MAVGPISPNLRTDASREGAAPTFVAPSGGKQISPGKLAGPVAFSETVPLQANNPLKSVHPGVSGFTMLGGTLPFAVHQQGDKITVSYTRQGLEACGRFLAGNKDDPAFKGGGFGKMNNFLLKGGFARPAGAMPKGAGPRVPARGS